MEVLLLGEAHPEIARKKQFHAAVEQFEALDGKTRDLVQTLVEISPLISLFRERQTRRTLSPRAHCPARCVEFTDLSGTFTNDSGADRSLTRVTGSTARETSARRFGDQSR